VILCWDAERCMRKKGGDAEKRGCNAVDREHSGTRRIGLRGTSIYTLGVHTLSEGVSGTQRQLTDGYQVNTGTGKFGLTSAPDQLTGEAQENPFWSHKVQDARKMPMWHLR
jgi:hypothetical protein